MPWLERKPLANDDVGPCEDIVLNVGDVLVLPRGVLHSAATTANDMSSHITFGIETSFWTVSELLHCAAERVAAHLADEHVAPLWHLAVQAAASDCESLRTSIDMLVTDARGVQEQEPLRVLAHFRDNVYGFVGSALSDLRAWLRQDDALHDFPPSFLPIGTHRVFLDRDRPELRADTALRSKLLDFLDLCAAVRVQTAAERECANLFALAFGAIALPAFRHERNLHLATRRRALDFALGAPQMHEDL